MCLTISSKAIDKQFSNNFSSFGGIFNALLQVISQYEMNHKEAFLNILNLRKIEIIKGQNENEIIGIKERDSVKATFDELNRLMELRTALNNSENKNSPYCT